MPDAATETPATNLPVATDDAPVYAQGYEPPATGEQATQEGAAASTASTSPATVEKPAGDDPAGEGAKKIRWRDEYFKLDRQLKEKERAIQRYEAHRDTIEAIETDPNFRSRLEQIRRGEAPPATKPAAKSNESFADPLESRVEELDRKLQEVDRRAAEREYQSMLEKELVKIGSEIEALKGDARFRGITIDAEEIKDYMYDNHESSPYRAALALHHDRILERERREALEGSAKRGKEAAAAGKTALPPGSGAAVTPVHGNYRDSLHEALAPLFQASH